MPAISIPARIVVPRDRPARHSLRKSLSHPAIFWLTCGAIITLFGVSSMLLTHWGFNYEMAGGSLIEKMHPGSWLAMIAAAMLLATGGPWRTAMDFIARHPLLIAYLSAWGFLFIYIILVQKLPFTPVIDTFFLPVVIFFLLDRLNETERRTIATAMHFFMLLNSLLGLAEVLSGWRLTPYVVGGEEILADWRATALLGHPLANACITGAYALILITGGGVTLNGPQRAIALIGATIGMVVFGGRAAMVFLLALSLPFLLLRGLQGLAFGRVTYKAAAIGAFCALGAPAVIAALVSVGAFDKFISRFIDDRGSANTRVVMFELFEQLPLRDILLGPHPDVLATLRTVEGLDYGIESFWIATILTYGLLVSLIFFAGIFCYCIELVRITNAGTWLALLYFFGVASTSVSLSAKSCILAIFTAMVIVLSESRKQLQRAP